MISNSEITTAVQRYLNTAISFMERKGYIAPTVVVLNKGKVLDIEVSHPFVFAVDTNADPEEFKLDGDIDEEIYEHGIAFKLTDEYSDKYLYDVAHKIAIEHEPDAICTLSACLFRMKSESGSDPQVSDIQEDPNVMRIIFACYYMKGDPEANYLITPYIKKEVEDPGFDSEAAYTITTMPGSWNAGLEGIPMLMPNPYMKEL